MTRSEEDIVNFAASLYVSASGHVYGASRTDQRGTRTTTGRTVGGRPVIHIGTWYGSQMSWQPYRDAVDEAMYQAVLLEIRGTA